MKQTLLYLAAIFCTVNIFAQSLDATRIELNIGGDSYPKEMVNAGDKLYFSADDGVNGRKLWAQNLITNITYLVKKSDENVSYNIETAHFTMVGTTLYFIAQTKNTPALWRSDGTAEGTYMVKQMLGQYYNVDDTGNFLSFNGKLYFSASDTENGNELWVSDGTAEGTSMVKDIYPGKGSSDIANMFVFNGSLYFVANDDHNFKMIWKSNGTAQGTNLLTNLNTFISYGTKPFVMNNNIYFITEDTVNGKKIWKSDGTTQGTIVLKEFNDTYTGSAFTIESLVTGNYFTFSLYTLNGTDLWTSDGTPEGTLSIKHFDPEPVDNFIDNITQFFNYKGITYFFKSYLGNLELWKTNGTAQGTQIVYNLKQVNINTVNRVIATDNFVMFNALNNDYNLVPIVSDCTLAGTKQLATITLNNISDDAAILTEAGGKVFFSAESDKSGQELWQTDGTTANTKLVKDIYHKYDGLPSSFHSGTALNGKMIFAGNDHLHNTEPFISDGTLTGTYIIKDVNPDFSSVLVPANSDTDIFYKSGNKLYYAGYDKNFGRELFITDGTAAGTHIIKDIAPGLRDGLSEYSLYNKGKEYNGIFYFVADDAIHGNELWRTDGTEAGTYMIKDINPGEPTGIYSSTQTIVYNGLIYFNAYDADGYGLWKTDGTEAGTVKAFNKAYTLIDANSSKLFLGFNDTNSDGLNTLWVSDGTESGTSLIKAFEYASNYQFKLHCVFNEELYYSGQESTGIQSIYKTNGTSQGTVALKGYDPGTFDISYLQPAGKYVYFSSQRGIYGNGDLWRTDGTVKGTINLTNSEENYLTRGGYYVKYNNLMYVEESLDVFKTLHITDGTVENTHVIDINITNAENFERYEGFTEILGIENNILYLGGSTLTSGKELYTATIPEGLLSTPEFNNPGETSAENTVVIYPNPTNGIINILSRTNAIIQNVEVYDFTGKKIVDKKINLTQVSLNIPNISAGIYLVKIKTDRGTVTKKIMHN